MDNLNGNAKEHEEGNKEFKIRVHDHDSHHFEPSPPPVIKNEYRMPKPHRHIPIAVPIIMLGSIAVFILAMYYNDCPSNIPAGSSCVGTWLGPMSFQPWDENPMLGPRTSILQDWGALESNLVTKKHEGWRLVSAIAVNAGVLQLIMNLLALLFVGIPMEVKFWFTPVALIYVVSGFGGSLLSALFIQTQIFAGASGAVMGILGAALAEIIINWERAERKCFNIFDLIFFMLVNFAFGLMPQVDNFANVGGLFTGFLLGFVLLKRPQLGFKDTRHLSQLEAFILNQEDADLPPVKMYKKYQKVLSILAFILVFGLIVAATVVLFLGIDVNSNCSWCHYASCVPNLKWSCPGIYRNP